MITVKNLQTMLKLQKTLGTKVFFTDPYASWQRGLNEQVNGLVRQYFPKKKKFSTITQQEVLYVTQKLNTRPRKSLGYKTPQEAFLNWLNYRVLHFEFELARVYKKNSNFRLKVALKEIKGKGTTAELCQEFSIESSQIFA